MLRGPRKTGRTNNMGRLHVLGLHRYVGRNQIGGNMEATPSETVLADSRPRGLGVSVQVRKLRQSGSATKKVAVPSQRCNPYTCGKIPVQSTRVELPAWLLPAWFPWPWNWCDSGFFRLDLPLPTLLGCLAFAEPSGYALNRRLHQMACSCSTLASRLRHAVPCGHPFFNFRSKQLLWPPAARRTPAKPADPPCKAPDRRLCQPGLLEQPQTRHFRKSAASVPAHL